MRHFLFICMSCVFAISNVQSQNVIDTSTINFSHPETGQFIRSYPRLFMDTSNRFIADYYYDSIYNILSQLPDNCIIEVAAYTGSNGNLQRNFTLTQKRARLFANYLASICAFPAERLQPKGYGETVLLNHCADGIACTEEEHKINTRIEFRILEIVQEE